jgi:DNA-directed RNA polymerase subunit M/transcription elongation factor TFIIS
MFFGGLFSAAAAATTGGKAESRSEVNASPPVVDVSSETTEGSEEETEESVEALECKSDSRWVHNTTYKSNKDLATDLLTCSKCYRRAQILP